MFESLTKEEKKQLLDFMNRNGEYHNGFTIVMILLCVLAMIRFISFLFIGMFINNGNNDMFALSISCLISTIIISVCSNVYTDSKFRKYYKVVYNRYRVFGKGRTFSLNEMFYSP